MIYYQEKVKKFIEILISFKASKLHILNRKENLVYFLKIPLPSRTLLLNLLFTVLILSPRNTKASLFHLLSPMPQLMSMSNLTPYLEFLQEPFLNLQSKREKCKLKYLLQQVFKIFSNK